MKKTVRNLILVLLAALLSVCPLRGTPAESEPPAEPLFVDLDLSRMSGTVVYAQIYNLLSDPAPWLGKIIRMSGLYSFYEDHERNIVYHACIVPDAAACCAQGIEFIWSGEHAWPGDYPEYGDGITVTGRLELYEEDGYTYLHLVDAELLPDPAQETSSVRPAVSRS